MWMVIKNCLLQTLNSVIPQLESLFKRTKMLTNESSSNNTYNRFSNKTICNVGFVGYFVLEAVEILLCEEEIWLC